MIERTFSAAVAGTFLLLTGGLAAACSAASPAASARPTPTHFSARYVQDGVDRWTCSGTHIASKGGRAKDTETCLITGDTTGYAKMVGTFTGHPDAKLPLGPPRPWHSDYNHAKAATYTMTIKDAGHLDSRGFRTYQAHIVAFYGS